MAAVPSKHDLASLVRSIRAEIALAVPIGSASAVGGPSEVEAIGGRGTTSGGGTEADLSLAPLLLKGVVTAMKLLCQKVEAMHSVEEVQRGPRDTTARVSAFYQTHSSTQGVGKSLR